jgi:hypothetical protein
MHASGGSGKNKQEMHEICIKWCFNGATDTTKVRQSLPTLLLSILKSFPKEILVLENSNQELAYKKVAANQSIKLQCIVDAKRVIHEANSSR